MNLSANTGVKHKNEGAEIQQNSCLVESIIEQVVCCQLFVLVASKVRFYHRLTAEAKGLELQESNKRRD
jgi:hypothetical protein